MSKTKLLDRQDSVLLVVDPQSSLIHQVQNSKQVIRAHKKIIETAKVLDVPIIVSEHYPKGLGTIIPEIVETLGGRYQPIEKVIFSAFGEPKIRNAIKATNKHTLLIIGIETHICILQTVIEALEAGYDVQVVIDAVSARGKIEHDVAVETFKLLGAGLVTWESVAYQWMRRADIPEFKKFLPIIKD